MEEKTERIVAYVIGTQAEDRSQRTSQAIRGWNFILSLPVCKKRYNIVMGWEQGKDSRMSKAHLWASQQGRLTQEGS